VLSVLCSVNLLLLKGRVHLPQKDQQAIGSEQLIGVVVDCLKRSMPKDLPVEHRGDYEKNLRDAIDNLHRLEYGLDVNLYFDRVNHFEFTSGCVLFDLLAVDLVHGWIVPSSDTAFKYIAVSE
jgi:ubiquitin carboxyl-terminal hydrolase MINDY-1/2